MNDRRAKFRKDLSPLYIPYYDSLCGVLGDEWQPYDGKRSPERQTYLFSLNQGLTDAEAWESSHQYGCGSDWAKIINGDFIWLKEDSIWQPYFNAIEKVGLKSGRSWGDYPHNELKIDCSWKLVKAAYFSGGWNKAQQFIQDHMVTNVM